MDQQLTPNQTRRYSYFQLFLIVDLFAFTALLLLATLYPYFSFDLIITRAIQNINFPGFEPVMVLLTTLGYLEWGTLATLIAAAAVSYLTKSWREGGLVIMSSLGAVVIATMFKYVANRPRPDASLIHQIGQAAAGSSFPSGHVLHYVGLYGFLLYLSFTRLRNHRLRYTLVTIFGLLLFLIGLSRIDLGAHWFSDVLGAYLIGIFWLYLMSLIDTRFRQKAPPIDTVKEIAHT